MTNFGLMLHRTDHGLILSWCLEGV